MKLTPRTRDQLLSALLVVVGLVTALSTDSDSTHYQLAYIGPGAGFAFLGSFLGLLSGAPTEGRLPGSLAAAVLAYRQGVRMFRVHDVRATREALSVVEAVYPHGTVPTPDPPRPRL